MQFSTYAALISVAIFAFPATGQCDTGRLASAGQTAEASQAEAPMPEFVSHNNYGQFLLACADSAAVLSNSRRSAEVLSAKFSGSSTGLNSRQLRGVIQQRAVITQALYIPKDLAPQPQFVRQKKMVAATTARLKTERKTVAKKLKIVESPTAKLKRASVPSTDRQRQAYNDPANSERSELLKRHVPIDDQSQPDSGSGIGGTLSRFFKKQLLGATDEPEPHRPRD